MRPLFTYSFIGICAALSSAVAQDSEPPAKLDLNAFPGEIVDKVVIPVPAEVFAVLDKLDEPNWGREVQIPNLDNSAGENPPRRDRVQLSLEFGSLVAEGFIAVQAQDAEKIKRIGEIALKLGNALGLGDAVKPHSLAIVDAAEKEDWRTVRIELDRTQATVGEVMEKMRDDDLGTLVSLGGWIRGTDALTSLISDNFTTDKSELLNQPELVDHFIETIETMEVATKNHADIIEIHKGLKTLEGLLRKEDRADPISADKVTAIGAVCQRLLKIYYFR